MLAVKHWVLASVAAFVVIFAVDFVVHGVLLKGLYETTASVWRPQIEAASKMWMMTLGQALFSFVLAWVYTKGYERGKPKLGQGFRYGVYMGLIIAVSQHVVWYVVLPIPFVLTLCWNAAVMANCILAGIAIGLIYEH